MQIIKIHYLILLSLLLNTQCHREQPSITKKDLYIYVNDLSSSVMKGRESGSRYSRKAAFYIANRYKQAGLTPAFTPGLKVHWSDQKPGHVIKNKSLQKGTKEATRKPVIQNRNKLSKKSVSSPYHGKLAKSYIDPANDPVLQMSPIADYIQPFGFKAGVKTGIRNILHLVSPEGKNQINSRVIPFPVSGPGSVAGELIFGGFCLQAPELKRDDFAGLDLKDKVVLCLRHGPGGDQNSKFRKHIGFRPKWNAARKAGAAGVVFLGREGYSLPGIHSFRVQMKPGPIAIFISHFVFLQQFPFLQAEYDQMLKGQPGTKIGFSFGNVRLQTDFNILDHAGYNTGAWLRPVRENQRLLIVGAHLDHLGHGFYSSMGSPGKLHFGADDNASGSAVLLELALAMKANNKKLPENVNVLFLHFDGEERGLIGSRHFVQSGFFLPVRRL